jgi:hypothetical protein
MPAPEDLGLFNKALVMAGPAEPGKLTQGKRFQQYFLATVGPAPLFGEAVSAGLEQWENSPEEWGQGWGAYAKRYRSDLGYNAIRQTISYGASVAFDEDSRYFASGERGVWPRTRHALISAFTARRSDGKVAFSISSVTGVVGASAFSSIWGPPGWKGPENIARNAGISFASTAGFNLVREFLWSIAHPHRAQP